MSHVWIALGSNLGDRGRQLSVAVDRLTQADLPASRLSHIYETTPEHGAEEPAYLNAVLQTESDRDPQDLLRQLQTIEEGLGRPSVGEEARCGSRVIDLDLLAVGDLVLGGAHREEALGGRVSGSGAGGLSHTSGAPLVLPHPRLHLRAFVLVPLCEIDPHWHHPITGRTAVSLLAELEVRPGSVQLYGSFQHEVPGCGPYPWRQLPARGGI